MNMIIPATIAATTPTAIPAIAPRVNPLLSIFPMIGVATVVPEVAPVAVPVTVVVLVPVLATVDSELLELLVEVLPILVENIDGVEFGTVVPIDSLGNILYSINAASIEFTPEFGELNVLTQILLLMLHVSWLVQHRWLALEWPQRI